MSKDRVNENLNKDRLKRRYDEEIVGIGQKLRSRKGGQEDEKFGSTVRVATAEKFRQIVRSDKDELTGLWKKHAFLEQIEGAINRAHHTDGSLNVILIDLDGFKNLNDTHGHQAGDAALKAVGEVLQQAVRSYDTVARLGGDEFGILQYNGENDAAEIIAERVKRSLRVHSAHIKGLDLIDASFGVARHMHEDSLLPANELLKRADTAMYVAKEGLTGKVVHWKPGIEKPVKVGR